MLINESMIMARENYNDLLAFLAVARERSFTRAAAQLGVSQSALSHTIRGLEARLGLRITTGEHAASSILWPVLRKLLPEYPDIRVEVISDSSLTDIVAERFDAGIRLGEQVANDMIALPIGPPMRMAVVGSPDYLASRPKLKTPRDLTSHDCINLRFLTRGGLYAWEFEKKGRALNVRVEGRLTFNNTRHIVAAARDSFGLACVPEDIVKADIASGKLQRLLADWCPPFPGYHLYYPSRRQPSPAFSLLVEALRYRDG